MKKSLIFGAMASMMLFATSCQEDFPVVETGSEAVVSFNLQTPQIATRVYSDGATATRLQYAVYKNVKTANGVELQYLENLTRTDEKLEGLKKEVNLKLTTGDTYTVVFWASEPNAPYTVTFDAAMPTVTVDYETAKLCNDENRDAFFNDTTFTVTGSVAMEVDLRRPFAQLNIGTSDYTEAANSGYEVEQTAVTVSKVYRTLNLVENANGTHSVSNPVENLKFDLNDIPDEDLNADGPFPVAGYKYLSMNYLLVPDEKEVLSQVTLTYNSTDGNTKDRKFGQIPVQRNYRTNIYGQLLTSNVDVFVEIIPAYYEPPFGPADHLREVLMNGGEITLYSDAALTESIEVPAGKTAKINLDGYTLNVNTDVTVAGNLEISNGKVDVDVAGEGDVNFAFVAENGATIDFNDVELEVSKRSAAVTVYREDNVTVNFNKTTMNVEGDGQGLFVPFGAENLIVNVTESKLTGQYAFYIFETKSATVFVDGKSEINKFWTGCGGNVTVVYEGTKPVVLDDGTAVNITYYTQEEWDLEQVMKNGGSVSLTADLELTKPFVVSEGVVAEVILNGRTLTVSEGVEVNGEVKFSHGNIVTNLEGRGIAFETKGANATVNFENVRMTVNGLNNGVVVESYGTNPDAEAIINLNHSTIYVKERAGHAIFVVHYVKDLELNVLDGSHIIGEQAVFIEKADKAVINIDETSSVQTVIGLYGTVTVVSASQEPTELQGDATFNTYSPEVYALKTALENSNGGSIDLANDYNYGTLTVGNVQNFTINGNGSTVIFKTEANTVIKNVTLKEVKFEYTGATADCGIVLNQNAQVENLVVENCEFVGTSAKAGRGLSGYNNNATITFKNCKFTDLGYPIYAWGGYAELTIDACTFTNIKSWAIMPQSGFDGDLTVTDCDFVNCIGGGLIKAGTLTAGHTFTFTGNEITGCTVTGDHNWFQFNVSAGTSVVENNTKDGQAWTPTTTDGLK